MSEVEESTGIDTETQSLDTEDQKKVKKKGKLFGDPVVEF